MAVACLAPAAAWAQTATWLLNPGTNAFGTAANWSPAIVPLGTATFGLSNTTTIDFPTSPTVGSFLFNAGASAYTFSDVSLTLNGAGIVNNSAQTQTFNLSTSAVSFNNSASAGSGVTFNVNGSVSLNFNDSSTAGRATIVVNNGSTLTLDDTSTAGNATITNNGAGAADDGLVRRRADAGLHRLWRLAANTSIAEALSLFLRDDGEVGTGIDNHVFTAGLRMSW